MVLSKKVETIQVTTLLTAIGKDAQEVFATFTNWENKTTMSK